MLFPPQRYWTETLRQFPRDKLKVHQPQKYNRMSSALLLLLSSTTACVSMALFRYVLHGRLSWTGSLTKFIRDTGMLCSQPLFLAALLAFATSTTLWLIVLATQKLSMAYPVQIGLVTLFTGIISVVVFKEIVPLRGYIGYVFLLVGVVLIFR